MNLRKQAPFSAPCGVPLPNKSPTQSPDISQSVSYFTVPPRAHPRHTGSQSRARHCPGLTGNDEVPNASDAIELVSLKIR